MMENEHGRIDLLTQEQIKWCYEHYFFEWFVKDDGKVYSKNEQVRFRNKKSIYSFSVDFGDCEYLDCSFCNNLRSLEGAPKNVSGNFGCSWCRSLGSLEGAPESVGGDFFCSCCDSLKSLEGAPESIGGDFDCSVCDSLESLKGISKNIGGNFTCHNCKSLESLEGSPLNVGGCFNCSECKSLEFIDGLKNTEIGKEIYYKNCSKLKKYDSILKNVNVFNTWKRSTCTADEFLKEYDGFLQAKKYGI